MVWKENTATPQDIVFLSRTTAPLSIIMTRAQHSTNARTCLAGCQSAGQETCSAHTGARLYLLFGHNCMSHESSRAGGGREENDMEERLHTPLVTSDLESSRDLD